ncbi:hypothetical protein CR513_13898, partial [Mucuna pruriens]
MCKKIKAILRKDNGLNAIEGRPIDIHEERGKEMDYNSLPDSYDQLIINITNNNIDGKLHFEDVAGAILEEESRQENKEDRLENMEQAKDLTMTRGRYKTLL